MLKLHYLENFRDKYKNTTKNNIIKNVNSTQNKYFIKVLLEGKFRRNNRVSKYARNEITMLTTKT